MPFKLRKVSSTPQKQPAPNIAFSVLIRSKVERFLPARVPTQPDRKNCPSGRSHTDVVFTLVHAMGSEGVSKHRATRNSRPAVHRWFATQRYDPLAHPARFGSRAPNSPHLGSHDAVPTYRR